MNVHGVIKQALIKSGAKNTKISKNEKNPKFRVHEGCLRLEGSVKNSEYSMKITDSKGKLVDSLTVSCKNGNDVVNRINESITTLLGLSKAYDNNARIMEDQEFDDIDDIDADENEAENVIDTLRDVYDTILNTAERTQDIVATMVDDDLDTATDIIGFAASLYDVALDIDDTIEDMTENDDEDEVTTESYNKNDKKILNSVLANLTESEIMIKKSGCAKRYSDIVRAIRDIKSELTVRGV